MRKPFLRPIQHETPKKIGRLIEAMLDFALITGFLAAVVFLVSINSRLVF